MSILTTLEMELLKLNSNLERKLWLHKTVVACLLAIIVVSFLPPYGVTEETHQISEALDLHEQSTNAQRKRASDDLDMRLAERNVAERLMSNARRKIANTEPAVSLREVISITVTPAVPALAVGEFMQLSVTATHHDGSRSDVTPKVVYTSSNLDMATVSPTGIFTGKMSGTVTIEASYDGKIGTTEIRSQD